MVQLTATTTLRSDTVSGKSKPYLSKIALFKYGAMAFPLAFAGLPIYLHAPDYYAVSLGQNLATLGLILLALRLIDAFQDPFIGSLSDRFHTHRNLVIAIGTLMLGGGFWMLFNPVTTSPLIWFAASVLICTTGFSVVTINLQALGGLWRCSSEDRTQVTGSREVLGLLGLLTAAITPPLLAKWFDSAGAFQMLTIAYLPLLAVALCFLISWTRTAPIQNPARTKHQNGWLGLLKDKWRVTFYGLAFVNTVSSAIPAVLVMFFIRDRLGAESYTGLFLLIYFLAGAASMPLWIRLAGQLGKFRTWQISLAVAVLTFCWAVLLGRGDIASYAAVCAFSGFALGADLALPPAILADHIEADNRQGEASRLFSLMALISKSALAIATGVTLPLLSVFGYVPNTSMTPDLDFALSLTYAALPCVLKLAALFGLLVLEKDLALNKSGV
ncbi:MAG: MFS transporter [Roseibium sp.]